MPHLGLQRITMKFGGTSVGNAERICNVADLTKRICDDGLQVVVVTSAMMGVTDHLLRRPDAHRAERVAVGFVAGALASARFV